jgi:hypothetical protein
MGGGVSDYVNEVYEVLKNKVIVIYDRMANVVLGMDKG